MAKARAILESMFGNLVRAHDVAAGCVDDADGLVIPIGLSEIDLDCPGIPNGVIIAFNFNGIDPGTKRLLKLLLMKSQNNAVEVEPGPGREKNESTGEGDRTLESLYRNVVSREFI